MTPLLSPELLRRLEALQLRAGRRAKSTAKGERRSRARGQSVEFADYRNYVAGDDLRYLDWNLYGRLDRLFLKTYEEERELPVTILLDASESMQFGEPSKFAWAQKVAAAVGYVALCGFDRVSIQIFPELANPSDDGTRRTELAHRRALESVRGKKSVLKFFDRMRGLTGGGSADFNAALRRTALKTGKPGLALVISDFLDPNGYEAGLNSLITRGFEIIALQVLSAEEWNPTITGDLRLIDAETGGVQEVTFGKYRLSAYQKTVANYVQRLREFAVKRGIRFFSVSSAISPEDLLLKDWRKAQIWA